MQKWLIALVGVIAMSAGYIVYQQQQYDFETLQGDQYSWQAMQGQWLVVNYFAEWCAPCLKEVPELNAFNDWAKTQDDVKLFAISYDALSADKLLDVQRTYDMQFSLLLPEKTVHVPITKPQYLPATYVIKPDGTITPPLLGEQTAASLQAAVEQLKQSF